MRRSVAALADAGFDGLVDDVWLDGEPAGYPELLERHRVWRVGLTASPGALDAREAGRGDRMEGLARARFPRVRVGMAYDLMLDTSGMSAEEAARRIAALARL